MYIFFYFPSFKCFFHLITCWLKVVHDRSQSHSKCVNVSLNSSNPCYCQIITQNTVCRFLKCFHFESRSCHVGWHKHNKKGLLKVIIKYQIKWTRKWKNWVESLLYLIATSFMKDPYDINKQTVIKKSISVSDLHKIELNHLTPCHCDVIYERSFCITETNPRRSSKCRTTDDAEVIIKKWMEDRIQRIEGDGEGFEPTTRRIPGMFNINL